jgi:hypothetical protein
MTTVYYLVFPSPEAIYFYKTASIKKYISCFAHWDGTDFLHIFWRAKVGFATPFDYVAHFVFLSFDPESCRSKQARYQLSHTGFTLPV